MPMEAIMKIAIDIFLFMGNYWWAFVALAVVAVICRAVIGGASPQ